MINEREKRTRREGGRGNREGGRECRERRERAREGEAIYIIASP